MIKYKKLRLTERDKRWINLLITPSWISLLLGICCAFGLLMGVLIASQFEGTRYQQQVAEMRAKQINAHYSSDDEVFEGLEGNTFTDIIPLLVLWGVVGIVVFFFASSIVQVLQHTAEFKEELGYVNADRKEMLKTAFIHLGIRIVVAGAWIVFILFFFDKIVPYGIEAALAVSAVGLHPESMLYALLCLVVVAVAMHVHTIFFRLLMLKPRVFSKALYIS